MPPRAYNAAAQAELEALAELDKVVVTPPKIRIPDAPKKSDGTLGSDGVRLRLKPMAQCKNCGQEIVFIKVGEYCVACMPTNVTVLDLEDARDS